MSVVNVHTTLCGISLEMIIFLANAGGLSEAYGVCNSVITIVPLDLRSGSEWPWKLLICSWIASMPSWQTIESLVFYFRSFWLILKPIKRKSYLEGRSFCQACAVRAICFLEVLAASGLGRAGGALHPIRTRVSLVVLFQSGPALRFLCFAFI